MFQTNEKMNIQINLPNNDNISENVSALINILNEMDSCEDKDILLNFSEVKWMPPCCIILISNKVVRLKEKGVRFEWIPSSNTKVNDHMVKLGFPIGSNVDGMSYVPITHIVKDASDRKKLGKEISNLLNKIIKKIPNNINGVSYILSELSDNIEDHSEYSCASIMAQYFPKKREAEIIVFDDGLTIPGVFSKNNVKFNYDSEAIEKAISGEISTPKMYKKEKGRGYGLRTCKSLSTEGFKGEIYVFSGKGVIIEKYNQKNTSSNLKTSLKGTLFCIKVRLPQREINFYERVE